MLADRRRFQRGVLRIKRGRHSGLGPCSARTDPEAWFALCFATEPRRKEGRWAFFALFPVGEPVSGHGGEPGWEDDLYCNRSRWRCRSERRRRNIQNGKSW